MQSHELVAGRTFGVTFDHGDEFFDALRKFCQENGVRQGYIPMFIAGFAEAEVVGTCEKLQDPAAPLWSGVHLENATIDVETAIRAIVIRSANDVAVVIAGEQGGRWVLTRTPERWRLAAGTAPAPAAQVTLDADTAWRRWTKGIGRDAALAAVSVSGERSLGLPVLDAVAIIG